MSEPCQKAVSGSAHDRDHTITRRGRSFTWLPLQSGWSQPTRTSSSGTRSRLASSEGAAPKTLGRGVWYGSYGASPTESSTRDRAQIPGSSREQSPEHQTREAGYPNAAMAGKREREAGDALLEGDVEG